MHNYKQVKKKFFYASPLNVADKWTIGIYIFGSLLAYFYYRSGPVQSSVNLLFYYALVTQWLLYVFNYRSMRNFTSYLMWCLVGISHFLLYFVLKNNPAWQSTNEYGLLCLRNTILLLLLFQVLRWFSLVVQGNEFIAPAKGSRMGVFGERKVNWIDFLILIIYISSTIALLFVK